MTNVKLASVGLALILSAIAVTNAEARCWKGETVSWYTDRHTASGEPYTYKESTCAHPTAKMGTRFKVTDNRTKKSVTCRVNDRGPNKWTRCKIDLNKHAAIKLAILKRGVIKAKIEKVHHGKTASLAHVTPKLASKARELVAACGAKVTSAYRPGARVRGSGVASLHSRYPSQAVDMAGNYRCIYAHLKGWAGGYSTDPGAVNHIHISLASDRRERGARFAHYGHRKTRYAALR